MLNQSFSSNQLIKFCKKNELEEYGLTKSELIVKLDEIFEQIVNGDFLFKISKTNKFYFTDELCQKLVLRKLNDNIKRLYKVEQANRKLIITQIKTLLEETVPFYLFKTDIKNFYESILRTRIQSKLLDDSLLSYHSLKLLNILLNNPPIDRGSGIPRGLNISATLSEIYMRKFDSWIRRLPGVYYYARFVDDIIIFTNNNKVSDLIKQNFNAQLKLLAEGLRKNGKKTNSYSSLNGIINKPFEYLGYKFTKDQSTNKHLNISIAQKKICKIKTRIILSFLDFIKNNNLKLLENRIKFLTGNYIIRKNKEGNKLKAGIFYNYLHVNNFDIFDELNNFFRKTLYSRNNSFGKKLHNALNVNERNLLLKFCFKKGFEYKLFHPFNHIEIKEIIECWQ